MLRYAGKYINALSGRFVFKYRLTVYFTLFGILIGHLTFVFYTSIVTNNLKYAVSSMLQEWLIHNNQPRDVIESYIGKSYDSSISSFLPFLSLFRSDPFYNDQKGSFDIYYLSSKENVWYRLIKNNYGLTGREPIGRDDIEEIPDLSSEKKVSFSYSFFFGKSDRVFFWFNITRGGDRNRYIVRVTAERKGVINFFGGRNSVAGYALFLVFMSFLLSKWVASRISKPISELNEQTKQIASGNLDIRTYINTRDEFGELSSSINTMADNIKKSIDEMTCRMDAVSVMNKIDKAVLSSISRHDLLDRVTFIVSELFRECFISLAIADIDEGKYTTLSHYMKGIKGYDIDGRPISFRQLGIRNIERNKKFFIIDKNTDSTGMAFLNSVIDEDFFQIMNVPIFLDETYIGSLIIGKIDEDEFSPFQIEILKALADQAGVAMKNVQFFEEKEKLFLGILIALSITIDTKSKWTSGHSERVSHYSGRLAAMMGMEEEFLGNLKISASLHDIGKIGVPESILDKHGKLDEQEFEIIKKHPQDGALIVEEIPGYEKFINGIIFHHESWDGNGYPYGLEGRAIPLMGRLIAVADVYDSLTSDRPYRSAMSVDDAVKILLYEKGKKLDPGIVELMMQIIDEEQKLKLDNQIE